MSDAKTDPITRRRRRHRRLISLGVFLALMTALVFGAFAMMGRPVAAPDWLRSKIEERIDQSLPGFDINFGQMSLAVNRSGQPQVILWDVDLRNAVGEQIAALADIEAGFSLSAVLRGELVLQSAQVSGAFVTLQRDAEGRFGLALGDVFAAGTQAPDLPQIISQVDQIMADPRLAELDLFEADALTIRYEDIRAHRGWTADGGRIRLTRADGKLQLSGDLALLGGGDRVATIEVNAESPLGSSRLDFGMKLGELWSRDIATQSPALAWLDVLEAPISGALRSNLAEDGSLGPLNATLQIGAGELRPNRDIRPLPFEGARTYFTYLPDSAQLRFDEISVSSEALDVLAEGKAMLQGVDGGWPTALTAQFQLPRITLAQGPFLDVPLELSDAHAAFKLTLNPFRLSLGNLRLNVAEAPLQAKGELAAFSDGWEVALDAQVAQTDPAQVLQYWPKAKATKVRTWLADNVLSGTLSDVVYALRAVPGAKPSHFLDMRFAEGRVRVNKDLPLLTGGAGRLTLHNKRLGLLVEQGVTAPSEGGVIDLSGSQFVIPDVSAKPAPAVISLAARGSLTAAMSYIDNDKWQVLRKVGRSPALATGQAEVTGRIALPLVKGIKLPDIALDLSGVLRQVESDSIVPDRVLTGERLQLTLDNDAVEISGAVALSGVPAAGTWRQPLNGGVGRVEADVTLSPQGLAAMGVTLPEGMVRGRGIGKLDLTLAKGAAPRFSLTSGLAGLGLSVPQLGWQLAPGATGQFQIAGTLGKPVRIDGLSLRGAGLEADGDLSLTAAGGFEALRFDRLKLADWLDVRAVLRGRGRGQAPAVEVASGRVDLRRAPFGSGAGSSGSGTSAGGGGAPLAVTLDRLQVTDSIWLDQFRGNFTTAGGLDGRFDGRLGGSAAVQGRVLPQNGASAFRISGEDAGDILAAAGILKTVQNGSFQLDLAPVAGRTGTYDGLMKIDGPRLRNAPAIGALLDAISIVGLLDQLNGPGIFFAEVEARFRLTPSRVILTQSSAVGPSMGISMDGFYDTAAGTMDMQGVVSPIYILNGIGRLISRKGEGLIGFNFNLTGPVAKPRVSVNPLSVFTPGMFRDIFRRPPPDVSQ